MGRLLAPLDEVDGAEKGHFATEQEPEKPQQVPVLDRAADRFGVLGGVHHAPIAKVEIEVSGVQQSVHLIVDGVNEIGAQISGEMQRPVVDPARKLGLHRRWESRQIRMCCQGFPGARAIQPWDIVSRTPNAAVRDGSDDAPADPELAVVAGVGSKLAIVPRVVSHPERPEPTKSSEDGLRGAHPRKATAGRPGLSQVPDVASRARVAPTFGVLPESAYAQ